ncbi:hypothetical protein DPX16_11840 [Anabarilius grahami]|uniref:Uncharacterized protein n=1 Tax=Anabarilius grahami TaxID=495550 RepID=A0A3N0Z895_ANAGA|nr:hypothetical protein DPX16_11840 [Anabarilius grahami]
MSDGRQRSAKRAWPSLPSIPYTPKKNHSGQSKRDATDAHFTNIHGPERKRINKQTERWGCKSGQREISARWHSTDQTAGTDTLHNPGKYRPLLKRPRPRERERK